MVMHIIKANSITKTFPGPIRALRGVSFEVEQDQNVAFLGSNGAAKSAFLDTALGLTQPSSGNI